ncbi:hypothetical protein [Streptomyces jumonjinensis]|uniref:hypothetical protein n=1 Tax=Streptomyces jumonjinensis TaxID=1945 RepID=UPI00129749B0|nr:hypothetical protein [Streptomyces jumonjinensis]
MSPAPLPHRDPGGTFETNPLPPPDPRPTEDPIGFLRAASASSPNRLDHDD